MFYHQTTKKQGITMIHETLWITLWFTLMNFPTDITSHFPTMTEKLHWIFTWNTSNAVATEMGTLAKNVMKTARISSRLGPDLLELCFELPSIPGATERPTQSSKSIWDLFRPYTFEVTDHPSNSAFYPSPKSRSILWGLKATTLHSNARY